MTATTETRRTGSGDGDLGFLPSTYRERERIVLPLTFPDGTRAELVYPPKLDIAALGVFPYTSGTLHGKSPTPGRSDFVARDFVMRFSNLEDLLEVWNEGTPPRLLAHYEGVDGQAVGLWDFGRDDTAHKLGFQFGRWAVLVYDYEAAGAMTDAERASWAVSFSGQETDDGFLLLEGTGPLRLARAGEHAGPELTFSGKIFIRVLPSETAVSRRPWDPEDVGGSVSRGERSGSRAGGRPVTFWSGSVVARSPRCVPLLV